ncbi:MAG: aminopeptidase P family N-terminal domain-containing protein [Actinomycetota bacterium]
MSVSLRECPLPVTEIPATPPPALTASVYRARIAAARTRAAAQGIDVLVVWADREHIANMSYLTGFDPRFEEALLIIPITGSRAPRLLVGNECLGYAPDPDIGLAVELWQELSLMGQPRDGSRTLHDILREEGVVVGTRIGCIGWKSYSPALVIPNSTVDDSTLIDMPAFVVDLLRSMVGATGHVVNSTSILMHVSDGLRLINEPEQIRLFEYAACVSSSGMMSLLKQVRPGVREDDLERELDSRGLTLSCHRMVGFGEKARRGLASASSNIAKQGDALTTAFGVAGALTCRAGAVASGPHEMPEATRDFYERFFANYFAVARAWYAALHLGATGGEVFAAAESQRDPSLFDFALNPGHYLHLDEWVNSPFVRDGVVTLRSGMAMQADIIPVSKGPFVYVNLEDGVALADDDLRATLREIDPALMKRVARRRDYMINVLGYELDDCVLPLGDTSGWLAPYVTDLSKALTAA